jgi:hypothetical protein
MIALQTVSINGVNHTIAESGPDTFAVDRRLCALAPGSYDPSNPTSVAAAVLALFAAADTPLVVDKRAPCLATLAAARYRREIAGLTIAALGGKTYATDRDSQSKIGLASAAAGAGAFATVNWKCADGSFTTLTAAQVQQLFMAAVGYVKACYDNEAALVAAISQASDPTAVDVTGGWPSNSV